jgi:hypothetical protein
MPTPRLNQYWLLPLLISTALPGWAENATLAKVSDLHAKPFIDAQIVTQLQASVTVDVIERKGGWSMVKHGQQQGWVRTLNLRFGSSNNNSAAVSDAYKIATGRAGSGNVVTTTGVRGLDEESLKTAQFNEQQIKLAESFRVSSTDAQAFARQAELSSQRISYLESTDDNSQGSSQGSSRRSDR